MGEAKFDARPHILITSAAAVRLALGTRSRQSEQQCCEHCTRARLAKSILAVPQRLASGRETALIAVGRRRANRMAGVVDAIMAIDERAAGLRGTTAITD
jgi:hypothetical protein